MKYPDSDRLLETAIHAWRNRLPAPPPVSLRLDRPWSESGAPADLHLDYQCRGNPEDPDLTFTVDGVTFGLQDPVALEAVPIAKPWGQEIWYTGIEARGESRVVGAGGTVSLAHYLAAAPDALCRRQAIVLLKVLDPRPEPVLGELYFEVHEEKREVYVVSHVDAGAWPEGQGAIRFGMDQRRREAMGDEAFRAAFLDAVARYERLRDQVDAGSRELGEEEAAARDAVHAFTALRPLRVGDVVVVPTWTPHALLHGVRVVEFQTPTYERHIISFGQKVLTQAHWDSALAISRMQLEPPEPAQFEPITPGVSRIARFPDFGVWRAAVEPGGRLQLPADLPYALCLCVDGEIELAGRTGSLNLTREKAAFIPHRALTAAVANASGTHPAIVLIAAPGL
ncbi:MAG: hypothetical protein R3E82_18105 [Pseudomonadales bacterium]